MRINLLLAACLVGSSLILSSCGGSPQPPKLEQYFTLGDVRGTTAFKEDSPGVRVMNVRAKAFIKDGQIISAQAAALEAATKLAVDMMVRELMSAEDYNKNYEQIDRYFSKNLDKYVVDKQVTATKKIYMDKFLGVFASFKLDRQKVLVALQKDLKLLDTSMNTLITVVTSKKGVDTNAFGLKFEDLETTLMNQAQTDLNQRGLRAMDFRNAVVSLQSDPVKGKAFEKMSREQFVNLVSGSPGAETVQKANEHYEGGLVLLKQLARIVVEVNILSVSKTNQSMVLNASVTAKNISTATGGAFANSVIQVARRAGANSDDSAMLTALIKDSYEEMKSEFIPQVIKEMSTIDAKGDKLQSYELVLQGFDSKDARMIRRSLEREQKDHFRYIDFNNELSRVEPPMNIVYVRWAGKASKLGDHIMGMLDDLRIGFEEPIIAPDQTDIVFVRKVEK